MCSEEFVFQSTTAKSPKSSGLRIIGQWPSSNAGHPSLPSIKTGGPSK